MKKTLKKTVALSLLAAMCIPFAGCSNGKDSGETMLTWYVLGEKPQDYDMVMEKVNEFTKE